MSDANHLCIYSMQKLEPSTSDPVAWLAFILLTMTSGDWNFLEQQQQQQPQCHKCPWRLAASHCCCCSAAMLHAPRICTLLKSHFHRLCPCRIQLHTCCASWVTSSFPVFQHLARRLLCHCCSRTALLLQRQWCAASNLAPSLGWHYQVAALCRSC